MIKKKRIELRCTTLEKAIIKKKAENTGLSTSEFCRASALGQKIGSKFTAEEMEIFQMLVKYHKNFTAISNLVKARDPSFSNECKELAGKFKEHLKKLQ